VPLQGVVDRWPLNLCLVARQSRLRISPEGQTPERQNKQRTGHNDFYANTHCRLHSCRRNLGLRRSALHRHRERRCELLHSRCDGRSRCDVSHIHPARRHEIGDAPTVCHAWPARHGGARPSRWAVARLRFKAGFRRLRVAGTIHLERNMHGPVAPRPPPMNFAAGNRGSTCNGF
jgi:hypothetical protein